MAASDHFDERAGVFEPDTILPEQYLDPVRRRAAHDPARLLMIAVLEDAVNLYLRDAGVRDARQAELFRDAEAWIESHDHGWLYSFENICATLGFAPEHIRRGLHAARDRASGRGEPRVALRASSDQPLRPTGACGRR